MPSVKSQLDHAARILLNGGVVVMPSDTIYGIFGRADIKETVERIRKIKGRDTDQAFIVLCSDPQSIIDDFSVDQDTVQRATKYWPGPISIILTPGSKRPEIQGDLEGIAFRIPKNETIQSLLESTGPLVAPSANPRALPPAKNIDEAKQYFGDMVDYYVDGGVIENVKPSRVIKINTDNSVQIIRE